MFSVNISDSMLIFLFFLKIKKMDEVWSNPDVPFFLVFVILWCFRIVTLGNKMFRAGFHYNYVFACVWFVLTVAYFESHKPYFDPSVEFGRLPFAVVSELVSILIQLIAESQILLALSLGIQLLGVCYYDFIDPRNYGFIQIKHL